MKVVIDRNPFLLFQGDTSVVVGYVTLSVFPQKSVTGKRHKFDGPAPESAHRLEGEPDTHHTASLIAKEEVKLGRKIGEGAHGAVHEGTWANVHGSVSP